MDEVWKRLTTLAAVQHGFVARWQVVADGIDVDAYAWHVRRGRLERAAHGVVRVAGAPLTPLGPAMLATLRAGRGARAVGIRLLAASGVAAAPDAPAVEVLVPPGRRLQNVPWAWRRDHWPGLGTPAMVDGVPSWSPARHLLELAAGAVGDRQLQATVDAMHWAGVGVDGAARLAMVAPMHVGVRRLLALGLLELDAPQSDGERGVVSLLAPWRSETQVLLAPDLRVDVLLRRWRVVVEYQGRGHGGLPGRGRDAPRDRRLRAMGYVVLYVTAADLAEPAALLERVAAVTRQRP